jgi:hypothetical protein
MVKLATGTNGDSERDQWWFRSSEQTSTDQDPYIDYTLAPVGGVVMPANTFAVLVPWLAVIGQVGCIGTVVVVAKKRFRS